jgi:uncharacterized membrane protein YkvA (DUF1232 family)
VSAWSVAGSVAAGLVLVWVALVVVLYALARKEDNPAGLRDLLRLVPDVVRLLRRLAADPSLPRGVRVRLVLLLVYLVLPIDLIPDFIPVVGYADDAVVVALALRSVVRAAGAGAIERHWPGTPQGLDAIMRLAGVQPHGR